MVHGVPEWIRRLRARFAAERPWPLDRSLPESMLERLAALEEAERRRSSGRDAQLEPRLKLRAAK